MNHSPDAPKGPQKEDDRAGRSSTAKAIETAHRITSISLSFVIPILGGFYIDQWLGSRFVCLLIGMALGMFIAGMQLMKLVSSLQANNE